MKVIDIVMLIIAIAIFAACVALLIYRKVSGKSATCDCGRAHVSGKSLVEEYRKEYPKSSCGENCCCKKKEE